MSLEQYNVKWDLFSDHLKEMMQNLMQSTDTADVTLVCQDKIKVKAHKFVLSSCSPFFRSIISDSQQKETIIYLKGLFGQEVRSILQFMYLGQTTSYEEGINDFISAAKSLEIEGIDSYTNVNEGQIENKFNPSYAEKKDDQVHKEFVCVQGDIEQLDGGYIFKRDPVGIESAEEESKQIDTNYKFQNDQYSCNKCHKKYTHQGTLRNHRITAHENIKYPCSYCNKTFTRTYSLNIHIKSVHEDTEYPCDLCNAIFSGPKALRRHKKCNH